MIPGSVCDDLGIDFVIGDAQINECKMLCVEQPQSHHTYSIYHDHVMGLGWIWDGDWVMGIGDGD